MNAGEMHPAATQHLPRFIAAPGEADYLYNLSIILLIIVVIVVGSFYFRLHALPERIAHGASQVQYQLVAVLALIALFTHNNLFWVIALLLALVPIPDFWTPLADMANSLARMAGRTPDVPEPEPLPEISPPREESAVHESAPPEAIAGDAASPTPKPAGREGSAA